MTKTKHWEFATVNLEANNEWPKNYDWLKPFIIGQNK
jgi:hypothetical protein